VTIFGLHDKNGIGVFEFSVSSAVIGQLLPIQLSHWWKQKLKYPLQWNARALV